MSAAKQYEKFHGKPVPRNRQWNFHTPKTLVILGEAVSVEYRCDKLNGGGDGKKAVYRHEFDSGAYICMDEKSRTQLYIIGKKIIVTAAGIEH